MSENEIQLRKNARFIRRRDGNPGLKRSPHGTARDDEGLRWRDVGVFQAVIWLRDSMIRSHSNVCPPSRSIGFVKSSKSGRILVNIGHYVSSDPCAGGYKNLRARMDLPL